MGTKRILIFAAHFYPCLGGYEKAIYELSRRLIEKGYEIDVITCSTEGASVNEEVDGIRIYKLPSWDILGGTYPIPKPIAATFKILFKLSRKRFDLVNTHTRFFSTSLLGLIFAKIKRTALVHTEHGARHSILSNKLIEAIGEIYDHTIGSLIIKSASRNIGISEAACDFLKHLGAKDTIVIPNGVDTDVFRKVETDLAKSLGLDGAIVITFVGRLIYAKGVQELISAFPKIKEAIPKAKLLIVGDGPYRGHLESLAYQTDCGDDILFLGEKNQAEVIEVLSTTDIFAHPSYSEGLGISVMEAASIGLPIIATGVGGTREILANYETGILIKAGDPTQLKDKVCELVVNAELRQKLAKNARKSVKQRFNWGKITRGWIEVIEGIG